MTVRGPAASDGAAAREGIAVRALTVGHRSRTWRGTTRYHAVLTGLDLTARPGELTVLLGPNGAGKTTLLHTLCGLLPPLAGTVGVAGLDIAACPPAEVARHLAVVLTDRVDAGLLSSREVAGLGRHPHTGFSGRLTAHDHAVVRWALDAVGAGALADRPAAELSDGERQRVLIARALAQEPRAILLDEPTAFLDVPSRVAITALLRDLARDRGLTVIASTHDLELALRTADTAWLLDRGARLHSGAPEDLIASGALAAAFAAGHLDFDPAAAGFRPRLATRGTAAVHAPEDLRPLLLRTLYREGFVLAPDEAEVDVEVKVEGEAKTQAEAGATLGGVLTARRKGVVVPVGSFQELARALRGALA
ncbi:ABC transporter ATP-binding protein [Streptomyces sp. NPDC059788]|uniref:ABC transporter ATP-binding protein n=1 Tax=Streptomyces sp. NPDC059788 TaxID=3346948 RepID=UPI003666792D